MVVEKQSIKAEILYIIMDSKSESVYYGVEI